MKKKRYFSNQLRAEKYAEAIGGTAYKTRSGKWSVAKKMKKNPPPVLIYGRVLRVEAQKTQDHICDAGCKRSGHRYFHNFKPGVLMYGLPNKDLLLTKRRH